MAERAGAILTARRAYLVPCHWCPRVDTLLNMTQDHLIPASRGGPNTGANVVLTCWDCNQARGNGPTYPGPVSALLAGILWRQKLQPQPHHPGIKRHDLPPLPSYITPLFPGKEPYRTRGKWARKFGREPYTVNAGAWRRSIGEMATIS